MFSSDSSGSLWNLLVPKTIEYTFSVETTFKVQSFEQEENLEISQEDEIIKRFNDNFFANDNLLMAAPLESKYDENQKLDRRRFDKVKQLLENDDNAENMEVDLEDQTESENTDYELDELNKHP